VSESIQQFLERRRRGIGGSDIADLFSLPPYGCARKLWYEKTGKQPDYPSKNQDALQRGIAMEPVIARLFAEKTGMQLFFEKDTVVSDHHPWAQAHVDTFAYTEEGFAVPVEIKAPGREVFLQLRKKGAADGYILQVQHILSVCDMPFGYFVAHCAEFWTQLIHFKVEADKGVQDRIIERGEKFWNLNVLGGEEPDRLPASDKRCASCEFRRSCQGEHMVALMKESGAVVFDESLSGLLQEFLEMRDIADAAEGELDLLKDAIRAKLGDRQAVEANGARVYYRPYEKSALSTKRIAATKQRILDVLKGLESKLGEQDLQVQALRNWVAEIYTPDVSTVRPLKVFPR